jgi:sporulation protein YlmC with PRC-barrel domain
MRLNELLGFRVVDLDGDEIGSVADVRLVHDGPLLTSMQRALRVDGLIVVENRATRLFGYERHVGPALLRRLVHSRLGQVWYLPWRDINRIADSTVITRTWRPDLQPLEEMARY